MAMRQHIFDADVGQNLSGAEIKSDLEGIPSLLETYDKTMEHTLAEVGSGEKTASPAGTPWSS